jgi:hypothetical protein
VNPDCTGTGTIMAPGMPDLHMQFIVALSGNTTHFDSKLTHIAHAFVLLTAKADGTVDIPAGTIEPALIKKGMPPASRC